MRLLRLLHTLLGVALGCQYIHDKEIIHGDLKPDNVSDKGYGLDGRGGRIVNLRMSQTCHPMSSSDPTLSSLGWDTQVLLVVSPNSPSGFIPKVADFGMSLNISTNHSHISGVQHGTPMYVAPEISREGRTSKVGHRDMIVWTRSGQARQQSSCSDVIPFKHPDSFPSPMSCLLLRPPTSTPLGSSCGSSTTTSPRGEGC